MGNDPLNNLFFVPTGCGIRIRLLMYLFLLKNVETPYSVPKQNDNDMPNGTCLSHARRTVLPPCVMRGGSGREQ